MDFQYILIVKSQNKFSGIITSLIATAFECVDYYLIVMAIILFKFVFNWCFDKNENLSKTRGFIFINREYLRVEVRIK